MMMMGTKKELTAQEKVTQEWDSMAGEWDDLAAGYATEFYQQLLKHCDDLFSSDASPSTKPVVVDFGAGTGLLTDKLRNQSSEILAIDVSAQMIGVLKDKIRSSEWENVRAFAVALSQLDSADAATQQAVQDFKGRADLVVASSVLSFIPDEDIEATMIAIGQLLKPGSGIFVHSDWPKSEAKHPDALDVTKAEKLYAYAGMKVQSTEVVQFSMGGDQSCDVFFGVARKE